MIEFRGFTLADSQMHTMTHIRPVVRTLASFLCLVMITGCDWADDHRLTPEKVKGVWTGDMYYKTYNGEDVEGRWVSSFRFDYSGAPLNCVAAGRDATHCEIGGSSEPIYIRTERLSEYDSYSRNSVIEYRGTPALWDGSLSLEWTETKDYTYANGDIVHDVATGTAELTRIDQYEEEVGSGVHLLGEFGEFSEDVPDDPEEPRSTFDNSTANVRVRGKLAYLARFRNGMSILDISDPTDIKQVSNSPVEEVHGSYFNDIKVMVAKEKPWALISDSSRGLVIYDVSDPAHPDPVGNVLPNPPIDLEIDTDEEPPYMENHTSFVEDKIAYLTVMGGNEYFDPETDGYPSGGIMAVDLRDPLKPKELGKWLASDLGGSHVHDLYVENKIGYLCAWQVGLAVVDMNDPAQPQLLGQFKHERNTSHSVWVTRVNDRLVAAHGDEDYGSHIRLIDVDPQSPEFMQQIGRFETRPEVSVHNIMAFGNEIFASYYQDGLRIVDISDFEKPKMTGWYNTWQGLKNPSAGRSFYDGAIGIDVRGDMIYVADISRGLLVFKRDR